MNIRSLFKYLVSFILVLSLVFAFAACTRDNTPQDDDPTVPQDIIIVKDGVTEYIAVYASADNKGGSYSYALSQKVGVQLTAKTDSETEIVKEILLGDTNRQLSLELKADTASKYAADSHIWGFAYKDGKFAFYFNTEVAFNKGLEKLAEVLIKDGSLIVAEDTWLTYEVTKEVYDAEVKAEEDRLKAEAEAKKKAELAKREEAAAALLGTFQNEKFGVTANWKTDYSMPTNSKYADPVSSITESHPRVMLTSDEVPKIKALLENPEYANMAKNFWDLADSKDFTGIFPEKTHKSGETYRYDTTILSQIEARALAYLITGEKAYAYEAIIGIKNAMLTLKYTTENHMDVYHGPSHVMTILAEVYDWCYTALSETDKAQLISGCVYLLINAEHFTDDDFVLDENKPSKKAELNKNKADYGLEFNFPPDNYNAVTGHGPGPQFLRDYMMVTMAFADEMPSWWDYVGGRFYQEYLPVAELLYMNGNVSQGTSCYAPIRIFTNLIPAYLIKTATGTNPYGDGLTECANFMLSHIMGNGKLFETGDGPRTGNGASVVYCYFYLFAALYNDTFSLQAAKYYSGDFKYFTNDSIYTMGPALTLALCSACDSATGKYPDDMPLITYTEYPVGQTTARNSWKTDAATVFMKINERTLAAHDLMDSGTFQIYYKGFLAVTSGTYADYGSVHHKYYLQATVSMNGLLIYNPSLASTQSGWYSGSQNVLDSATSLQQLQSSTYNVAKVTGFENAYNGKKAHYAYLAGDITKSYNSTTVDEVERRMLTVFTDDEAAPMFFFVYDNITSSDKDFKKSFLLHTVNEPTISGAATDNKAFTVTPDASGKMVATVVNGDGKLVLTNVLGGDYMHKIGGEGYAYWIGNNNEFDGTAASGKNLVDDYTTTDKSDTIWGRIEITAKGEKTTNMLNAMYVTDANSTTMLETVGFETDKVAGATIKNVTAVFIKESARNTSNIEFTTSGSGTMKYYISGMYQGTWNILLNGEKVGEATATEDGGFLSFTAGVGKIALTPGSDILPTGHSFISYDTNGGQLPSDAPTTYEEGVGILLTNVIPTHETHRFGGWYFDSELTQPAQVIDASKTGNVKLYAKWHKGILSADFSTGDKNSGGVGYQTYGKVGASFEIKEDAEGNSYLEWIKGDNDPILNKTSPTNNFSTIEDPDSLVSLTFDLAKIKDRSVIGARVLLIARDADGGGNINVFSIDDSGNVLMNGNSGYNIGSITESGLVIRILVDFKNATLSAYNENGEVIKQCSIQVSGVEKTVEQWRKENLVQYVLYFHAHKGAGDSALRVNKIEYYEGNVFEKEEEVTLDPEIRYVTSGGTLPQGAPKVYVEGEELDISGVIPSHPSKIFAGWYFDEELTERATNIPATSKGNVKLYAKWTNALLNVDYSKADPGDAGINYPTSIKPTSSFEVKTDSDGKSYLEWLRGDIDSFIAKQTPGGLNFSNITSEDLTISFEFDLAMLEGKKAIEARVLLLVPGAKGGESVNVFQITTNGDVLLNYTDNDRVNYPTDRVFCNIANGGTVRVAVDFKNNKIIGYKNDGTTVTADLTVPGSVASEFSTPNEWRIAKLADYLLYFHGLVNDDPNTGLRVNRMTIVDGNIFE